MPGCIASHNPSRLLAGLLFSGNAPLVAFVSRGAQRVCEPTTLSHYEVD